jgi:ABC-type nitrate/sulfonate/bicarbonate transport system permease component
VSGPTRSRLDLAPLILPALVLVAWEIASATGLLRAVFFPRPSTIARLLVAQIADGTLLGHLGLTVARLTAAFVLAAVPGVAVGLAMGMSRRTREGLDPLFALIYPIPSVLFLPLVSFALRKEEVAVAVTAAFTSFFLVAYTTMTGVQQLDRTVLEAARHFGAHGRRFFLTVLLPATLPAIFTGLRLGLGYTLIVVVAIEMVSAQRGLGAVLWLSWQILKVEEMYVALVTVAALGAVLTGVVEWLRRRLIPWAQDIAEVGA